MSSASKTAIFSYLKYKYAEAFCIVLVKDVGGFFDKCNVVTFIVLLNIGEYCEK
jgi:hypothetical protein